MSPRLCAQARACAFRCLAWHAAPCRASRLCGRVGGWEPARFLHLWGRPQLPAGVDPAAPPCCPGCLQSRVRRSPWRTPGELLWLPAVLRWLQPAGTPGGRPPPSRSTSTPPNRPGSLPSHVPTDRTAGTPAASSLSTSHSCPLRCGPTWSGSCYPPCWCGGSPHRELARAGDGQDAGAPHGPRGCSAAGTRRRCASVHAPPPSCSRPHHLNHLTACRRSSPSC